MIPETESFNSPISVLLEMFRDGADKRMGFHPNETTPTDHLLLAKHDTESENTAKQKTAATKGIIINLILFHYASRNIASYDSISNPYRLCVMPRSTYVILM
mmetsp:Transcript_13184/g.21641  ORF Transcript_13184/g.21641 Transcript_13184/m.21641 type:complete len:102 (+) Transcript_13184:1832-2137(+)